MVDKPSAATPSWMIYIGSLAIVLSWSSRLNILCSRRYFLRLDDVWVFGICLLPGLQGRRSYLEIRGETPFLKAPARVRRGQRCPALYLFADVCWSIDFSKETFVFWPHGIALFDVSTRHLLIVRVEVLRLPSHFGVIST